MKVKASLFTAFFILSIQFLTISVQGASDDYYYYDGSTTMRPTPSASSSPSSSASEWDTAETAAESTLTTKSIKSTTMKKSSTKTAYEYYNDDEEAKSSATSVTTATTPEATTAETTEAATSITTTATDASASTTAAAESYYYEPASWDSVESSGSWASTDDNQKTDFMDMFAGPSGRAEDMPSKPKDPLISARRRLRGSRKSIDGFDDTTEEPGALSMPNAKKKKTTRKKKKMKAAIKAAIKSASVPAQPHNDNHNDDNSLKGALPSPVINTLSNETFSNETDSYSDLSSDAPTIITATPSSTTTEPPPEPIIIFMDTHTPFRSASTSQQQLQPQENKDGKRTGEVNTIARSQISIQSLPSLRRRPAVVSIPKQPRRPAAMMKPAPPPAVIEPKPGSRQKDVQDLMRNFMKAKNLIESPPPKPEIIVSRRKPPTTANTRSKMDSSFRSPISFFTASSVSNGQEPKLIGQAVDRAPPTFTTVNKIPEKQFQFPEPQPKTPPKFMFTTVHDIPDHQTSKNGVEQPNNKADNTDTNPPSSLRPYQTVTLEDGIEYLVYPFVGYVPRFERVEERSKTHLLHDVILDNGRRARRILFEKPQEPRSSQNSRRGAQTHNEAHLGNQIVYELDNQVRRQSEDSSFQIPLMPTSEANIASRRKKDRFPQSEKFDLGEPTSKFIQKAIKSPHGMIIFGDAHGVMNSETGEQAPVTLGQLKGGLLKSGHQKSKRQNDRAQKPAFVGRSQSSVDREILNESRQKLQAMAQKIFGENVQLYRIEDMAKQVERSQNKETNLEAAAEESWSTPSETQEETPSQETMITTTPEPTEDLEEVEKEENEGFTGPQRPRRIQAEYRQNTGRMAAVNRSIMIERLLNGNQYSPRRRKRLMQQRREPRKRKIRHRPNRSRPSSTRRQNNREQSNYPNRQSFFRRPQTTKTIIRSSSSADPRYSNSFGHVGGLLGRW